MGGASGRRVTAVDESRKETADGVAKYQNDYVVGREPGYATRTSNCCGAFIVLRFSCPFALSRVLCSCCYIVFVCHIYLRGRHDTSFEILLFVFY